MEQYGYSHSPSTTKRSLWDKIWRDRNGRLAIWQMPNVWLVVWAAGTTLSLFFGGQVSDVLFWVASASLIVWSILEILQGVCYFRRILGLAVLAYAIASVIKSL